MNQETRIINHLRAVGSISGLEANDLYRVRDLPKRISQIQQAHHLRRNESIRKERRKDATGQRYMRYHLDQLPEVCHA